MVEETAHLRPVKAQAAEVDRYDALYRSHLERIYGFIVRRVGRPEVAEDLTAEVFLKGLRWLQTNRSPQEISAWLHATARSAVADYWRNHLHPPIDIATVENLLSDSKPPQEVLPRDGGDDTRVACILARLSERERKVLELRFLHGYTAREIAGEMQLSEGNVRVLQYRALKRAASLERGHDGPQ